MSGKFHFAVDRVPVGVHIKYTHKYRQLQAAAFQYVGLVDFFKGYNLAVDARDDHVGLIAREVAAGRAEKVYGQQVEAYGDCGNGNGDSLDANTQPQRYVDSHQQE